MKPKMLPMQRLESEEQTELGTTLSFMKDFHVNSDTGRFGVQFDKVIIRIDSNTNKLVRIRRHVNETHLSAQKVIKFWVDNGGGSIEDLRSLWCETLIDKNAVNDVSNLIPKEQSNDTIRAALKEFGTVINELFHNPYELLDPAPSVATESVPTTPVNDTLEYARTKFVTLETVEEYTTQGQRKDRDKTNNNSENIETSVTITPNLTEMSKSGGNKATSATDLTEIPADVADGSDIGNDGKDANDETGGIEENLVIYNHKTDDLEVLLFRDVSEVSNINGIKDINAPNSVERAVSDPTLHHVLKRASVSLHQERAKIEQSKKEEKTHADWEEYVFIFVQINAIFQLILDIVLEVLHLVPRRVNHLSLTTINAFLAYKTLSAIKQNKFRFLHEDVQCLLVIEIALVFGDLFVLVDEPCLPSAKDFDLVAFFFARATFISLSIFNGLVCLYVMQRYKLWHCYYVGDQSESGFSILPLLLIGRNLFHHNSNNNENKDESEKSIFNHNKTNKKNNHLTVTFNMKHHSHKNHNNNGKPKSKVKGNNGINDDEATKREIHPIAEEEGNV